MLLVRAHLSQGHSLSVLGNEVPVLALVSVECKRSSGPLPRIEAGQKTLGALCHQRRNLNLLRIDHITVAVFSANRGCPHKERGRKKGSTPHMFPSEKTHVTCTLPHRRRSGSANQQRTCAGSMLILDRTSVGPTGRSGYRLSCHRFVQCGSDVVLGA